MSKGKELLKSFDIVAQDWGWKKDSGGPRAFACASRNHSKAFGHLLDYILELEDREKKLIALENGGVDNWEGYYDSIEGYRDD